MFTLEETVTLYDLTNTYMEGQAQSNAKASHGRSKEKRTDCPLVTLGLVLDGSGFVRRSQTVSPGQVASALTWKQELVQGSMATHPGVYCLRTNVLDWDAPRLWQMYSTLTDIESVFRSLKGELGLRPVFHQTEFRADGHLFITVLAYQCVQVIRKTLKAQGIHGSWASLRQTLSQQVRVTVTMQRSDGRSIHIRQASKAEPAVKQIYRALGISAAPGGSKKLVV